MTTIIRPQFRSHKLTENGQQRSHQIRLVLSEAMSQLESLIGDKPSNGRELAVMRTKLEEAGMYAQHALTLNSAHVVGDEG